MDLVQARKITDALKRLGSEERRYVVLWLLRYYDDLGRMFTGGTGKRSRATIDGLDYLLVRAKIK
jgi:hypothetical protein